MAATPLAARACRGLIPELLDAVLDDPLIVLVVYVHRGPVLKLLAANRAHGRALRMRSRGKIAGCIYAQK